MFVKKIKYLDIFILANSLLIFSKKSLIVFPFFFILLPSPISYFHINCFISKNHTFYPLYILVSRTILLSYHSLGAPSFLYAVSNML